MRVGEHNLETESETVTKDFKVSKVRTGDMFGQGYQRVICLIHSKSSLLIIFTYH